MAARPYMWTGLIAKVHVNSEDPSSIEWESDTEYEANTAVSYDGKSYISRYDIADTVGNPAENPDMWALTGMIIE